MQNKYVAIALAGALVMSATQARAEGKNGVAAVVNGEKITVAEIKEAYNQNKQIKDKVAFKDFYAKALDVYVNGKLLYQEAIKANVTETPEYKKQLEMAKEEIARKVYLEEQVKNKVSDAEVKKVYADYKKNFKSGKEIKAKHILVDSEAKAKEVIAKLNKGGNFDKLAKEYSKEPAELGYFTKEVMVPEFGEAAFALKKGEYSKTPVKTQFGYHVIEVEDIRDAKAMPLKDVEPQLKAMLTQGAIGGVFEKITGEATVTKYNLDGSTAK